MKYIIEFPNKFGEKTDYDIHTAIFTPEQFHCGITNNVLLFAGRNSAFSCRLTNSDIEIFNYMLENNLQMCTDIDKIYYIKY